MAAQDGPAHFLFRSPCSSPCPPSHCFLTLLLLLVLTVHILIHILLVSAGWGQQVRRRAGFPSTSLG